MMPAKQDGMLRCGEESIFVESVRVGSIVRNLQPGSKSRGFSTV